MKNLTKSIPALALAALVIAGPVSAASISDVFTPVDTASVLLSVDDEGVATLTGAVEGIGDKYTLERAVMDLEEVEEVHSFLTF